MMEYSGCPSIDFRNLFASTDINDVHKLATGLIYATGFTGDAAKKFTKLLDIAKAQNDIDKCLMVVFLAKCASGYSKLEWKLAIIRNAQRREYFNTETEKNEEVII